jgi:DNA-3-methyladenine glycosylase
MFGAAGHLYVYFTYGMHHCANVVTGKPGEGCAVLIRAVEPVSGTERMIRNRGLDRGTGRERVSPRLLTGGPARVCQAFGLTMKHNGTNLGGGDIYLIGSGQVPEREIVCTPRVGISSGKGRKWRFLLRGNPFVSRK